MSLLSWIVVGVIGGFIGSKLVNKTGAGLARDIILGIAGGILGGLLLGLFGIHGVTGINLWSVLVSAAGAVLVLIIYHKLFGKAPTSAA